MSCRLNCILPFFPLKLLIFDIDGTLTKLDGATTRAFKIAFENVFECNANVQGLVMHGRTDPLIFRDCYVNSGMSGDWQKDFERFKPVYLDSLPGTLCATPNACLHPGVLELLERLATLPECYALALGTGNVESGARHKIGHFNLNHFFPVGGFGDVHHERYLIMQDAVSAARRYYGVDFDPRQTWVIGDTVLDIEGGKRNGLRTLGVATGGKYTLDDLIEAGADAALHNLADTEDVLRIFDRA